MEQKASHPPVCLGIPVCRTGEENVEYQEGQQNAQHSDKLQNGHCTDTAVFLLLHGLDQSGKHHADAEEIADVCEMHVKIPANGMDVIENSQACKAAYEAEGAVNCLKNQLCCSVSDHDHSPFCLIDGSMTGAYQHTIRILNQSYILSAYALQKCDTKRFLIRPGAIAGLRNTVFKLNHFILNSNKIV